MIATTFPHDPFNRDVMESFYVPEFIWKFWLDAWLVLASLSIVIYHFNFASQSCRLEQL